MIVVILILTVLNVVLGLVSVWQRNEQIRLKRKQLSNGD